MSARSMHLPYAVHVGRVSGTSSLSRAFLLGGAAQDHDPDCREGRPDTTTNLPVRRLAETRR
jgi:hypothetical protein